MDLMSVQYLKPGHSLRQTHTVSFGSFKEGLYGYPERPAPAVVAEIICDYAAVRLLRLLIVEDDVRKVTRGLASVYERRKHGRHRGGKAPSRRGLSCARPGVAESGKSIAKKRPKGRFLCLYTSRTNLSQALMIVVSPRWT